MKCVEAKKGGPTEPIRNSFYFGRADREKRFDCDDDPPFRDDSPRGPILQLWEEGREGDPSVELRSDREPRFGDFGTSNIPNPIISFAGPPPLKNAPVVVSDGGGGGGRF